MLVLTAIIPLLVAISSILIFLRPALISQISADMERDAQTNIQLTDTYLSERLNDIKTLSEAPAVKDTLANAQAHRGPVSDLLFNVLHRDISNYISLSLLNPQGNLVLSYPAAPLAHGKYLIEPEALQQMQQTDEIVFSDVFYDPVANNPSVDLYVRVIDNNFQTLGYVRASLGLHRIWQAVDSEPRTNGSDSYAFVLDQHGVRIAYTNPDQSGFTHPQYLFKAIAPLSADFQQRIKNENLYGNSTTAVSTVDDAKLAAMQSNVQSSLIFQFDPTGQNQTYEVARATSSVIPWTFYLLKPLSTVTGLADQQLFGVLLIVTLMLVAAMIIGLRAGRGITVPIMRSVTSLRKNSLSLKTLSDEEQVVATQQSWMVEASQTAMKSTNYYTNAIHTVTQRLSVICNGLTQRTNDFMDPGLKRALREVAAGVAYIERANEYQESANQKLTTALRVTAQAAEQLANGAKSTDEAAAQLEQVVRQLTAVVGTENAYPVETQGEKEKESL
ncbi:MAG: cache domain-containing protein [Ktedonobacteraceae bacterium]|nr:cache domain-containing protein [Ktedonobacteraceae bacterium]